jgi:hypothetical protein
VQSSAYKGGAKEQVGVNTSGRKYQSIVSKPWECEVLSTQHSPTRAHLPPPLVMRKNR